MGIFHQKIYNTFNNVYEHDGWLEGRTSVILSTIPCTFWSRWEKLLQQKSFHCRSKAGKLIIFIALT